MPPLDARWTARVLAGSPLARQILAVLSRPDSEAIQDLTALIPPGGTVKEQHILFSILGHLSARNKAHFDSLAFLLAARQLQGRTEEARYPFADRVLAHELTMCGLHQEALLILDLTK